MTSSGSNIGEFGSNEYGYYWKLSNGILIQWGKGKCYEYQRYPVSFKNNVSPVISGGGKGASMIDKTVLANFDSNGFIAHLSDGYSQHDAFFWIAIGQ